MQKYIKPEEAALIPCAHSGSHGDGIPPPLRENRVGIRQSEGEAAAKPLIIVKRPAEKGNVAFQPAALGQSRHRLVDNGLKYRCGDIAVICAGV
ncbi:hypothetical protein SDC9_76698 [bioreactor metagenome]|uniref:Uncharacterized protein n=1 Tax=bioreactor metagenome TaxID=1076179 RepID=A0A644YUK4_9ZZZZ